MFTFSTIVAHDDHRGIGKDGKIPWKLSDDLKAFARLTKDNVIIMGRKTFESIGRILPDRVSVVVSKTLTSYPNAVFNPKKYNNEELIFFNDIEECFKFCSTIKKNKFVIGGQEIYKWFLNYGVITKEYITQVHGDFKCDTFYPVYDYGNYCCDFSSYPTATENGVEYRYSDYNYSNMHEKMFLLTGGFIEFVMIEEFGDLDLPT